MTMDLKGMPRKELLKLQTEIQKELKAAEQRERREALRAAEDAAAKYGFSLDELSGSAGKGGTKQPKAPAKYRNPENPDQTWSGRGRKPQWVHDALAKGGQIEDFAI